MLRMLIALFMLPLCCSCSPYAAADISEQVLPECHRRRHPSHSWNQQLATRCNKMQQSQEMSREGHGRSGRSMKKIEEVASRSVVVQTKLN